MSNNPLPQDVRMRGFAHRTPVAQAQTWVDSQAVASRHEVVDLAELAGRVLAEDVESRVNVPQFDRAMMDGYALQAADIAGADTYNRLELEVIGESLPGAPFAGGVRRGTAVRIMTGAPVPAGADAVLPVEQTESEGGRIAALAAIPPGKHVGRRGEDVAAGQVVLPAARRLRPQDLGVLSSIGVAQAKVVVRPKVEVIVTGNELLPAGSAPAEHQIAEHQIVDANGPMLRALAQRDGGEIHCGPIVPDRPEAILAALERAADVILLSGGSSVGQEDHAPRLLAEHGELAIHGVAMRPSSPAGMGRIGERLFFLLPGNPVSCLCAYDFFAGRAIRRLAGRSPQWPYRCIRAPLARKLVSQIGRLDYARVRLVKGEIEPLAISGASMLTSTTRADGFVVIDPDSEGLPAGDETDVWLYD